MSRRSQRPAERAGGKLQRLPVLPAQQRHRAAPLQQQPLGQRTVQHAHARVGAHRVQEGEGAVDPHPAGDVHPVRPHPVGGGRAAQVVKAREARRQRGVQERALPGGQGGLVAGVGGQQPAMAAAGRRPGAGILDAVDGRAQPAPGPAPVAGQPRPAVVVGRQPPSGAALVVGRAAADRPRWRAGARRHSRPSSRRPRRRRPARCRSCVQCNEARAVETARRPCGPRRCRAPPVRVTGTGELLITACTRCARPFVPHGCRRVLSPVPAVAHREGTAAAGRTGAVTGATRWPDRRGER